MTTPPDVIRAWAHEQGLIDSDRGRISRAVREAYALEHDGEVITPDVDPPAAAKSGTAAGGPPDDTEPPGPDVREVAPRIPKPPRKRLRDRIAPGKGKPKPPPRPRLPRVNLAPMIENMWTWGGKIVGNVNRPVGTMLLIEAPVAGPLLDPTIKGTVLDRLAQPIARAGEKAQVWTALAAPPALVFLLQMPPRGEINQAYLARQATLEALLRESLRMHLKIAGPALAARAEQERQDEEQYGETVDQLLARIFAPPPEGPVRDSADEEEAVRRARQA
jgi:hypothetical protein